MKFLHRERRGADFKAMCGRNIRAFLSAPGRNPNASYIDALTTLQDYYNRKDVDR